MNQYEVFVLVLNRWRRYSHRCAVNEWEDSKWIVFLSVFQSPVMGYAAR